MCYHACIAIRATQDKLLRAIRNDRAARYLRIAAAGYPNIVAGDVNISRLADSQVSAAGEGVCYSRVYKFCKLPNCVSQVIFKRFHGLNYPIEVQVV